MLLLKKIVCSNAFLEFLSMLLSTKKQQVEGQQNTFAISFSNINSDEHVSRKINTFTFDKGFLGAIYGR